MPASCSLLNWNLPNTQQFRECWGRVGGGQWVQDNLATVREFTSRRDGGLIESLAEHQQLRPLRFIRRRRGLRRSHQQFNRLQPSGGKAAVQVIKSALRVLRLFVSQEKHRELCRLQRHHVERVVEIYCIAAQENLLRIRRRRRN